ncbi:MAG: serine/threonine protein kinase [Deltaproteobacteria bacterium]|nr:MAG: serine/threonine protein kinase [Deltaproteobacteria bacterium]
MPVTGTPTPTIDAPALADEAAVAARVRARLFGGDATADEGRPADDGHLPARIGRFEVRALVGRGAMGRVLRAYDPDLDREVAIKILADVAASGADDEEEAARLRREAKVLARLSHPNVVAVHEVGTFEGSVYVAMEFVEGATLGDWLRTHQPPVDRIVDALVQAGEGLAAAHAAGIVHRDFKPANVLVGDDGRVRVVDFGLAHRRSPHTLPPETGGPASADALAMAGTPAFMAPERLRGQPADEAADQFAFGVTAYFALFGTYPHEGDDPFSRAVAIVENRRRPVPEGTPAVPRHVRRVVERCLAHAPGDRYPDMAAVVTDLRRDPLRTWRRLGVSAVLAAATGLAAYLAAPNEDLAATCAGAAEIVAPLQATAQALFDASGEGWQTTASRSVARHLEALGKAHVDACIAERTEMVSAEQAAHTDACLRLAMAESRALLDIVPSLAPHRTPFVAAVAADLTPPEGCLHPRADGAAPFDPRGLEGAVADLVRARLAARSGAYREAEHLARRVVERSRDAEAAGLEARARYVLGAALERLGRRDDAEQELRLAMVAAERAGDDLARARASSYLVYVVGRIRGDVDQALDLAHQTRSLLDAVDADDAVRADFENNLGAVLARAGRLDEAAAAHERAHRLRLQHFGPTHPATLASEAAMAIVDSSRGRHDQAIRALEALHARAVADLGPDDPATLSIAGNLATALARAGRTRRAADTLSELVRRTEAALGSQAPMLPTWIYNLATARAKMGDHDQARRLYVRGLRLRRAQGHDPASEVRWLSALAKTEVALGDLEGARRHLDEALATALRHAAAPRRTAEIHRQLADVERRRGAPANVVFHHEQAAAEIDRALARPRDSSDTPMGR